MVMKRMAFGRPSEVTNPGDDSRSFLFPFAIIDADLVGAPEEEQSTSEHRLIVTITGSRLPAWHLPDADLIRMLFEIGRRDVAEKVKEGKLEREWRVAVTTATHPAVCPFDPGRIPDPEGCNMDVEQERKIGFR